MAEFGKMQKLAVVPVQVYQVKKMGGWSGIAARTWRVDAPF